MTEVCLHFKTQFYDATNRGYATEEMVLLLALGRSDLRIYFIDGAGSIPLRFVVARTGLAA